MSMPIQSQTEQYGAFAEQRWAKDRHARHDEAEVADMLRGPSIHAGLNDTRQAGWHDTNFDPRVDAGPEYYDHHGPSASDLYEHEPRQIGGEEFEEEFPGGEPQHENYDAYAHEPQTPLHPLDDMLEHARRPDAAPPGHFGSRLGFNKRAAAVPPAQPAAPAQPQWLGHTFAPGHRVGVPWKDSLIPGTVTHLEGYKVGVRYDDGQHAVEEPTDLRPLY